MNTEPIQPAPTRVTGKAARTATIFTIVVLTILATLLWARGEDFYRLPLAERADHPDFRTLSPSGLVGQGYGVIGFLLILSNLLYLIRRKLAGLPLGPLRSWLNMHVLTGLGGSLLIAFHSAFQVRNAVAGISVVSLTVVVMTGVIGRYLFAIAPSVDMARLAAHLRDLDTAIPGLGADIRETLRKHPITELKGKVNLFRAILTVPTWYLEMHERKKLINESWIRWLPHYRRQNPQEVRILVKETRRLAAAQVKSMMGSTLLRVWKPMHRVFAILMLLAVAIHIGVAWYYGYRWILS